MKKIFIFILFLSFIVAPKINAQLVVYPGTGTFKVDLVTYVTTTATLMTVGWDPSEGATEYEIELFSVNRNAYIVKATTANNTLSFIAPFQGLFSIRLRATATAFDGSKIHSDWVSSDNVETAVVDSLPRGWWIYAFIAPPGEIQ